MAPAPFTRLAIAGLLLLGLPPAGAGLLGGSNDADFLDVDEAFQPRAALSDDTVSVTWRIADGYYLYRHALDFRAPDGVTLGEPEIPDGRAKTDEFFGEVETYRDRLTVRVPVEAGADALSGLTVTYQGCADAGLCYPPQTRELALAANDTASPPPGAGPGQGAGPTRTSGSGGEPYVAEQDRLAGMLANAGFGWTMATFFGLGVLLAFTPCVLPMIPILLGLVVGGSQSAGASRGLILSAAYVIAMALAYTVFGVIAGLFGANLQAALQSPWVLAPFAALFVALALAMFGVYQLQLPSGWTERVHQWSGRIAGGGVAGAAAMGFLAALIVGPCLAPPLAGALLYIGASGDAVLGGSALFSLGLGMGMPLIALGTVGGSALPRAGAWMQEVNAFFGVLLLGVAIWLLGRILPGALTLVLWSALAAGYAVHLGALEPLASGAAAGRRLAKAAGALTLVYAVMLLVGAGLGAGDPLRPLSPLAGAGPAGAEAAAGTPFTRAEDLQDLRDRLAAAAADGRPAVVDFYADWCVECVEMERTVFADPDVRRALSDVRALQVDVTEYDAADRALLQAFGVLGPPTILFFGADGEERGDHRLIGEVDADGFIAHLDRALSR